MFITTVPLTHVCSCVSQPQPANILLDEHGHVRISDLGLACDFSKRKPHASVWVWLIQIFDRSSCCCCVYSCTLLPSSVPHRNPNAPPSSEWGSYWPPLTLARRQVSCRLVASDTYVTALIYDTHINPDIVSDCVVNTQPQQLMDSEPDNTAAMTVLFSVNDGQKSQPSPVSGSIFVCRLQQWTVTSEHLSWLCAVFFFFFAVVLMVTWLQRFCRKVQRTTAVLTGSL